MISEDTKYEMKRVSSYCDMFFASLYDRWQDERDYEDFAEYKKVMIAQVKRCKPDAEIAKVGKRPFGVTVRFDNIEMVIFATSTKCGYKYRELQQKAA